MPVPLIVFSLTLWIAPGEQTPPWKTKRATSGASAGSAQPFGRVADDPFGKTVASRPAPDSASIVSWKSNYQ